MAHMSRRAFLLRGAALAVTPWLMGTLTSPGSAKAATSAASAREAYFQYCDELMWLVEDDWSASAGRYLAGETMSNANLLLVHATTAQFGHDGAARQDERARSLAAKLCGSPPWRGPERAAAYHARDVLALPDATVLAIRDRIRSCAYGTFYAYPQLRLNQINWPIEIYAHAAAVLGESRLLEHDARLQLGRFADHIARAAPGDKVPYTGPGYHFHYLPRNAAESPANVDNAEYATSSAASSPTTSRRAARAWRSSRRRSFGGRGSR